MIATSSSRKEQMQQKNTPDEYNSSSYEFTTVMMMSSCSLAEEQEHEQSNNKTTTTTTTKKKKKISFAPRVRAKKTLGLKSYTEYEIECTWYDEEELELIRLENHQTVVQMRQRRSSTSTSSTSDDDLLLHHPILLDNGEKDNNHFCYRGLEHQNKNGDLLMNQQIQLVSRTAVLQEQQNQRRRCEMGRLGGGINDSIQLAKIYKEVSESSQIAAINRARVDEQVVARDYQQQQQQEEMSSSSSLQQEGEGENDQQLGEMRICTNRASSLILQHRERLRKRHSARVRLM